MTDPLEDLADAVSDDDAARRRQRLDDTDAVLTETIRARGHEHVSATHPSTFEVTTDDYLTPAGDCILAIGADRAPADFDPTFVAACRKQSAAISLTIEAGGHSDTVVGRGDPRLSFENERSAVGRTSTYVDDRTILLEADHAAHGFDRSLIEELADGVPVTVMLSVAPVRE